MGKPVSMTGFGRGASTGEGSSWTVELRSVNHRYLDVSVKLPRKFIGWDERIKKEISSFHSRGRVDIFITSTDEGVGSAKMKADLGLAKEYGFEEGTIFRASKELEGRLVKTAGKKAPSNRWE